MQCNDPNARGVAQQGNALNIKCQCINGFKSSNMNAEDIKSLLRDVDVCIPCSSAFECGTAPSESPTDGPTISMMPSLNPTISISPTSVPTVSAIPSIYPTTAEPTLQPTISLKPSSPLTSSPTKYMSIFDGKYCEFDLECRSGNCNDHLCLSQVSAMRSDLVPLTLSKCIFNHLEKYHPFIVQTWLLTVEDENVSTTVGAYLLPSWSDGKDDENEQSGSNDSGGIAVNRDGDSVYISGSVNEMFRLTKAVSVNIFTMLQLFVVGANDASGRVGICVYESLPGGNNVAELQNGRRCHETQSSSLTNDAVEVSFGQLLNGKKTQVEFIELYASNAAFSISSVAIVQGESTDIYDENGCKDQNAETVGSGEATKCFCKGGYVSSNGGKQQGPYDSCIRCIESDYCGFDGEPCGSNDECFAGACFDDKCEARVSSYYNLCRFCFCTKTSSHFV